MQSDQIKEHRTMRSLADDPNVIAAVMPDGRIKWLRWGVGVGSPHLRQSTLVVDGVKRSTVHLSDRAVQEGWRLLSDLYAEEGRDEEAASYRAYMAAALADRDPGPFPDRNLPASVLRKREDAARPAWRPLPVLDLKIEGGADGG